MKKINDVISWLKRNEVLVLRLLIIGIFFIVPFSQLIMLSGIPIPILKMEVNPPGYPVEGKSWNIQIWGSVDNGRTWETVENASIEINTANEGKFVLLSDEDGKASFSYIEAMGTVGFNASSEKYGTDEWIPQIRFVDNTVARLVIFFFGLGGSSIIWQAIAKAKRKDIIDEILYYTLLISSVTGWLLSFYWFFQWKWGTEWGFGNRIVTLYYPICFDPHLIAISTIVMASMFLIGIKTLLARDYDTGNRRIEENTFTETHYRKIRQITFEMLTIFFLGFLLNVFAGIVFDWIFDPTVLWSNVQKGALTILLVVIFTFLTLYLMVRLRKPHNVLMRTAYCNLLWDIKHKRMVESIYDHPTGYSPQQFGFQMYEVIAKHDPELLKGLGKEATKEDIKIIADMLEYLVFLWLGLDTLKPTYRLGFKPRTVDLEEISKYLGKNRIVTLASDQRTGLSPPNIFVELPENVSLSVLKPGKLVIANQYFSIHIIYHQLIRSLSSMIMGPVPSIMGMPVNPFFLEKERRPERRLGLSGLRVAFCEMFFVARFNERALLVRPHKIRMFYKYMRWVEQLSDLFLDFFDWGRNIEVAVKSRNNRIYEILKGIEARIESLEQGVK